MKTKALALAPIETVNKSHVPKPTKTEILEALVKIKVAELEKEIVENKQKRKSLEKSLREKLTAYVRENSASINPRISLGYDSGNKPYGVNAQFDLDNLPKSIATKIMAYHNLPYLGSVDIKEVRKEIRESLNGVASTSSSNRIEALISNPETAKALKAILVEIGVSEEVKTITV